MRDCDLLSPVGPVPWKPPVLRACGAGLFILLFAGIARALIGRNARRLERMLGRERVRIARDLHDNLGASLARLAVMSDRAMRIQKLEDSTRQRFLEMGLAARSAARLLDESVWAITPQNDTVERLVGYLGETVVEHLEAAGIAVTLDLPAKLQPLPVSAEIRCNLLLAVKEAAGNIIKHARATTAALSFACSHDELRATLSDDGCGFERGLVGASANGLRNMRRRLEEIGGSTLIETRLEGGTVVSFRVSLSGRRHSGATRT